MRTKRSAFTVLLVSACVTLLILSASTAATGDSVAFQKRRVAGAVVYVITCDLRDPTIRVRIGIPEQGLARSESFLHIVQRHKPIAAVTGTYFDTRTLLPVGSIITGGKSVYLRAIGTAVCFIRPGSEATTTPNSTLPEPYNVRLLNTRAGERCDWSDVECGLRAGPRLLAGGRYAFDPRREGFTHPGLFGSRRRMALGLTHNNKLLLVAIKTPVTFARAATIMKALGARDALCLDGGSSSAMYYRGRVICAPGRKLTNIIEIHKVTVIAAAEEQHSAPRALVAERFAFKAIPAKGGVTIRRSTTGQYTPSRVGPSRPGPHVHFEHYAVLVRPLELRRAQGVIPFGPVNRTQFPGLKRLKNAKHLVHVASDVQIVHHLVA